MALVVSGSLAYDRILNFKGHFVEHIIKDKIHALSVSFLIDSVEESFGGTAGNIAYSLSLLGETPRILATAGSDFGPYAQWLTKNNIPTESVRIAKSERTAFATIMTDLDDNQVTGFYQGAMALPYGEAYGLSAEDLVIVAPGNLDDMRTVPKRCRDTGIPFVYDPGQQIIALSKEDLQRGIAGARALVSNDYEFALIARKTGWREADILSRAGMIVTTLGAKGSRITTSGGVTEVGTANPAVVDPTGAGDAYRAGFLVALKRGFPAVSAARLGSTVAAYAIEVKGTQTHRFTRAELAERYRAAYHEDLSL